MPSHIVSIGDTFATVSTIQYGEPSQAGLIQSANPGASTPLTPGTILNIPVLPALTPPPAALSPTVDPEEVTVTIDGSEFAFWTQVTITRGVDSIDTIELVAPRADTPEFKALFRPLSFKHMSVKVGGKPLFTGTMLEPRPSVSTEEPPAVLVSGYSTPGVLDDCTAPASMYPIQYKGMSLLQLSEALTAPFGIAVVQQEDTPGALAGKLSRVRLRPDRTVLDLLVSLAQQKKALYASTPDGELLLRTPPIVSAPVVTLRQGDAGPLIAASMQTAPQQYYSDVTGVRRVGRNSLGGQHTVLNPALRGLGVLRPLTRHIDDVTSGELPASAEALAGRMLAEAVTVTATVGTWLDGIDGDLWEPGTTVSLQAPGAMIYEPYDFIIREVRLMRDVTKSTAQLSLVLPGAFSGEIPDVLPWD